MNRIYFDNAATTRVREEVMEAMLPFYMDEPGNPSSVYAIARNAKKAIESSREKVAKAIGADASEIYFTGGGTEADNWAIKGIAEAYEDKGQHIITSAVEHPAVLHCCEYLEKKGFEVTYLPVDEFGMIRIDELKRAIRPSTILISVMFANNEVGTLQPIAEIGQIAKDRQIIFHTDAVQAIGHVPVDVRSMGIDMLSLSAHKCYGPKGVGALYVKKGIKIKPLIHGGAQEKNRRAGTENVPGIVGLGKAIELMSAEMDEEVIRLTALRDVCIDSILSAIPHTRLNGHREKRLPGNINISFSYIEGESLLLLLDMKGIFASSGSACTSGSLDPSHVLTAMGLPHEQAHGSLRITLGRYNSQDDIDALMRELPPIVNRLREMSPLC